MQAFSAAQSSIFNDDLFVEDIEFCASECHIQDGGMINKSATQLCSFTASIIATLFSLGGVQ